MVAGKRKLSQNQSKKRDELKSSVKFLGSFGDINISDLLDPQKISLGDLEFALYQLVQLVLKEFNWQHKCTIILNDCPALTKKAN